MAQDQVLEDLEQIARNLDAELRASPQYAMLEDVRSLIGRRRKLLGLPVDAPDYPREADGDRRGASPARDGTVAALVQEAAADFLKTIGRRAQTPEIAAEITRRGIRAGKPENITATVSSYLSSAKGRFDNVRGEGYGLVEWLSGATDRITLRSLRNTLM